MRLRRRGRGVLRERELIDAVGGAPAPLRFQSRCARLGVPAHEYAQFGIVGVGHRGDEIVAGHGLPVMAAEVEAHARTEALRSKQGMQHANDFGSFFVHRGGVEVVDLPVAVGADRVRHRAIVFGKLGGTQFAHVVDALDGPSRGRARVARGAGEHVGGELLVAEDGETFFERELEPVAAGDAIARPVVEVFVSDDGFDARVVGVGGGFGTGEYVFGVEDVEALVFHRAHVEVGYGDDHVAVEVEFQAKAFFVPAQGVDERVERVSGTVEIAFFHPDLKQYFTTRGGLDPAIQRHQLCGHQGEKVGRFREGVFPARRVPAIGKRDGFDQVSIGEQYRALAAFRFDGHDVARHDVGAVGKVGDAAEALGFALGEETAIGQIHARERGIGFRVDPGDDFDHDLTGIRGCADIQRVADFAQGGGFAVDPHREALQVFSPQPQGAVFDPRPVYADHAIGDDGRFRFETEMQVDTLDGPGQGLVVGTVYRRGSLFRIHEANPIKSKCVV